MFILCPPFFVTNVNALTSITSHLTIGKSWDLPCLFVLVSSTFIFTLVHWSRFPKAHRWQVTGEGWWRYSDVTLSRICLPLTVAYFCSFRPILFSFKVFILYKYFVYICMNIYSIYCINLYTHICMYIYILKHSLFSTRF